MPRLALAILAAAAAAARGWHAPRTRACAAPRLTRPRARRGEEAPASAPARGEPATLESSAVLLARAAAVGAATGVAVSGFKLSIAALEKWSYGPYLREGFLLLGDAGTTGLGSALVYASVPALGGAAVGLARALFPAADDEERRTDLGPAVARAFAAAATLGTGNSLGPEGPAVELGEAVAARAAPENDRRTTAILAAAGRAAGVAAGFSAPIAGIFYALEVAAGPDGVVVLPRAAVAATAIAAGLSALVSQDVMSVRLALASPAYGGGASPALDLPSYLGLGVLCGFVALGLRYAIFSASAAWAASGVPETARPALAGLGAGLLGVAAPQVLFNGYATLNTIINDADPGSAPELLALCVLKIGATAAAAGAGLVGGLFAPSLFLGATAGGAFRCWNLNHSEDGRPGISLPTPPSRSNRTRFPRFLNRSSAKLPEFSTTEKKKIGEIRSGAVELKVS